MGYDLSDRLWEILEGHECYFSQDEDGDITIAVEGEIDDNTFTQLESAVSKWSDFDGGEYELPVKSQDERRTYITVCKLTD